MAEERLVDFWASTITARSPVVMQQLRAVAQGFIAARQALRETMPAEFVHNPPLDLLYAVFVADHHTLPVATLLDSVPVAPAVASRWIEVFVQRDIIALHGSDAMLTERGFAMMAAACQAIIESQMAGCSMRLN